MSIPTESQPLAVERFQWAVRLSPLFVSAILAWLWIVGSPPTVPDLRLSAPVVARPGSTVGLRAWVFTENERHGLSVAAPEVRVELRDSQGRVVAQTALARSHVEGLEGRLEVPDSLDCACTLVGTTTIDERDVTVERTLYVRDGIDSKLGAGRTVNAFQAYTLGPLRRLAPDLAPSVLDPRIEEGVCVPDLECTLSVWVGAWEGRIRPTPAAGLSVRSGPVRTEGGFARFPMTVVGPEGRLVVEALGEDGAVLAARHVRLPVVQGGMTASADVHGRDVTLHWHSLGADAPILVDRFDGHRWVDAFSLVRTEPHIRIRDPGVWRLQVRRDLFSENTAAVTFAVIERDEEPVRMTAEFVLSRGNDQGLDPLANAVVSGEFVGDADAATRALFAIPAFSVVELGEGASARVGVDEATERIQRGRRVQAAALILVVGLLVSLVLFRLEVVAAARANRVLQSLATDDDALTTRSVSGRGLWALVLLVFGVVAVLALSKGWF